MNLPREQFRELLIEALDDPATARLVARKLLLPAFPIQGGACTVDPATILAGNFSCPGNFNFTGGNVGIGTTTPHSKLAVTGLPTYANNAAAINGGLAVGDFYRTGADPDTVCVVH